MQVITQQVRDTLFPLKGLAVDVEAPTPVAFNAAVETPQQPCYTIPSPGDSPHFQLINHHMPLRVFGSSSDPAVRGVPP